MPPTNGVDNFLLRTDLPRTAGRIVCAHRRGSGWRSVLSGWTGGLVLIAATTGCVPSEMMTDDGSMTNRHVTSYEAAPTNQSAENSASQTTDNTQDLATNVIRLVESSTAAQPPDAESVSQLQSAVDAAFDSLLEGNPEIAIATLADAQLVRGWAQSPQAPSILYWLAQSHERLHQYNAAMVSYRQVLTRYPDSAWSKRARKRLTALESNHE